MWNAKVKCKRVWDKLDNRGFVKGEIYKVKDGKLLLPDGTESSVYKNLEHLNENFYASFEEVKK